MIAVFETRWRLAVVPAVVAGVDVAGVDPRIGERDRRILALLASGATDDAIARRLGLGLGLGRRTVARTSRPSSPTWAPPPGAGGAGGGGLPDQRAARCRAKNPRTMWRIRGIAALGSTVPISASRVRAVSNPAACSRGTIAA